MNKEDMECKVIASLMIMLDDKFSNEAKIKAMEDVKKIFEKQQKEIEKLDKKFQYAVPDDVINDLYISKDKIRDLIQEIKKIKKLADEQIKDRRIIFAESESLNLGYSVAHRKDIDLLKELLGE